MNNKISLIIPVYGVEKYIERCCISIFEQTYKNFELIFVNDCSKDKSEEILLDVIDRYSHIGINILYFKHEVNKGISATRETGLNAATGDYVLYVDSDDYLALNALELLIDGAIRKDADIVYCDFYEVKDGQKRQYDQSIQVNVPLLITEAFLRSEISWVLWNKLFRRSLILKHNIHWPVDVNVGEDLVVMSQLFFYSRKIVHVNKPLYFYNRDNINSYINSWNKESAFQNIKAIQITNNFFERQVANFSLLEALTMAKLMARFQLLYTFDDQLRKLAAESFTETNDKIFSYKNTTFYWKVTLFFVVTNRRILSCLALKSIFLLKKLRAYTRH